ncbi:MAG: hypothetical protein CL677_04940 [Bdellovibrionaceae bacterium]|nr:hypothetical protein [Pseudobdellovibrionaceae bacterium]|tara:strand:+ start:201632 stop:202564 length:933 start_codon:yes stop_codon:yes gene_type:complete
MNLKRCLLFLFVIATTSQLAIAQSGEWNSANEDEALDQYTLLGKPLPNEIPTPSFSDSFSRLPKDWTLFKRMVVDKRNRHHIYQLGYITGALLATDHETWSALKRSNDKEDSIESINEHFVGLGDGFFQMAVAGVFGAVGYIAEDNLAKRTSFQIVEVFLATGSVAHLMKHVTGRQSPSRATSRTGNWEPLPDQNRYYEDVKAYGSFPSANLATFYASFKVIEDNYRHHTWLPYLRYFLTTGVVLGNTGQSKHWLSEAPISIAIGHVFAKIVTRNNHPDNRLEMQKYETIKIVPMFSPKGDSLVGVQWAW